MANLDGLNPALRSIVERIIAESGGKVTISSGYRSRDEQQRLYDLYKSGQGNLAAKPGSSKHEHGEAVDFGGDLELAGQLARKYGLVASVPGEPWHFTLGGEEGEHTTRYENYDDLSAGNPQNVLANRLHSILRIMGQDQTTSMSWGDPETDAMFQRGDVDGNAVAQQLQAGGPDTNATPKNELQLYASKKLTEMGFNMNDVGALIKLWNKESGWNPNADNPTSTAYGIAQFLDSTWKGVGMTKTSDPYKQIDAGLQYIINRYGNPTKALSFHEQNNWY